MVILVISELGAFLYPSMQSNMFVESPLSADIVARGESSSSKLPITLDIDLPHVPCSSTCFDIDVSTAF